MASAPDFYERGGILNIGGKIAAVALLAFSGPVAGANPTAPVVKAGGVTFTQNGGTLTVNQLKQAAIVEWKSFGNNPGETLRFNQPSSTAAILNRVTGGNPTAILGNLSANGRVFVLNPNGVLVGAGARIDTNGFYASTRHISDEAFLAGGDLHFSGDSGASIVNLGMITAHDGDIVLIARTVENRGELNAPRGVVALAAGTEVMLKASGTDRIYILSDAAGETAARGVDNTGVVNAAQAELKAAGGNAYALAVNSGGAITATGIATRNGRIVLTAGGGDVAVAGDLTARNADGSGGEILVGGDFQGTNAANVARAANTTIAATARLDASAADGARDGGKVVVWSDGLTRFDGAIAATGARGGDAEVSGRQLALTGHADLRGAAPGTLLLDPDSIVIDNSGTAYNSAASGTSIVGNAWINAQLDSGNLELKADHAITGNADAPIAWSAGTGLKLTGIIMTLDGAITGTNAGSSLTFKHSTTTTTYGDEELISGSGSVSANAPVRVGTLTFDSIQNILFANAAIEAGRVHVMFRPTGGDMTLEPTTLDLGNANNAITRITAEGYDGGPIEFSNDIVIRNGASRIIGDAAGGHNDAKLIARNVDVAVRGNLTLTDDDGTNTTEIRANGDAPSGVNANVTLRAIGGQFVNEAGPDAVANSGGPNSRTLIYSTTPLTYNGVAFDDGGLGFDRQRGVASDSASAPGIGDMFYFANNLVTVQTRDATRVYGAANPTFAYDTVIDGSGAAPVFSGMQFTLTGYTTGDAGVYDIVASGATAPGYDIDYASTPGRLTVSKANLVIGANPASRTYGAANPAFIATYAGLVNGDTGASLGFTPTLATAATTASPVANYDITPSGPAGTTNYNITYAPGALNITPANLTFTANDASRAYGENNPVFTGTGSGYVVSGETDASVIYGGAHYAVTADNRSNVGTYTITPSGALAYNYTITNYVRGTLTIRPICLSASTARRASMAPPTPRSPAASSAA